MSNYDPFGGGSGDRDRDRDDRDYSGSQNQGKNSKLIKNTITWLIVIGIICVIVYFLFFNNAVVTFDTKNTEGQAIPASILISKDESMLGNLEKTTAREGIKLTKGTYWYSAQNKDYSSKKGTITVKTDTTESVVLEKNIKLKITDVTAPAQVFAGQELQLNVSLENTSPTTDYNLDNLKFEGIIKDINDFQIVDIDNVAQDKSLFRIGAQTKQNVIFSFRLPKTAKVGDKQSLGVSIKYKLDRKTTTTNVLKEPEITVTLTSMKTTLTSGESKTFTCKINNSKNNVIINDITYEIDVNSSNNGDVTSWFNIPANQTMVDKKEIKDELIGLIIPASAKADTITGTLYVRSSSFTKDQNFQIEIEIKEPLIKFTGTLSKETVNLVYDENLNTTTEEYLNLKLTNNNPINIDVVGITIENGGDKIDCNNFIYVADVYKTMKILAGSDQTALINVKIIDLLQGPTVINTSRACVLKISYKHPYRDNEYLDIKKNITIYVKPK
ncbi:MAG: hypothetical protein WCF78_01670 [archaeon]